MCRLLPTSLQRQITSQCDLPATSYYDFPPTYYCNLPTTSYYDLLAMYYCNHPTTSYYDLSTTYYCNLPATYSCNLPTTSYCDLPATYYSNLPTTSYYGLPATYYSNLPTTFCLQMTEQTNSYDRTFIGPRILHNVAPYPVSIPMSSASNLSLPFFQHNMDHFKELGEIITITGAIVYIIQYQSTTGPITARMFSSLLECITEQC